MASLTPERAFILSILPSIAFDTNQTNKTRSMNAPRGRGCRSEKQLAPAFKIIEHHFSEALDRWRKNDGETTSHVGVMTGLVHVSGEPVTSEKLDSIKDGFAQRLKEIVGLDNIDEHFALSAHFKPLPLRDGLGIVIHYSVAWPSPKPYTRGEQVLVHSIQCS